MSEPLLSPAGKKTKKITWFINIILGTTFIGALIWGGMQFFNYRNSTGDAPPSSSPAIVSIDTPRNGDQFEIGEAIIVEASAVGPHDFLSIELWLDGELAGVQAAPAGGLHPFNTQFSWMPVAPGLHSLIAAAVDDNGEKTMSSQEVVMVAENESGIVMDSTGDVPEVLPAPAEGTTPPAGPAGGAVWPAGNWGGTLGDWATSLTEDEKPAAPELVAAAKQCSAILQIHDLSNNEEGFVVYRQTINSRAWTKVATLSSQSDVEWISFQDEGIYGAVTYYVTAFNVNGEAASNLTLVNIDPQGCDGGESEISATQVDLTLQVPDTGAEKVYCYKSTDGVHWTRWPHFGFLTPDEDGYLPANILQVQRQSDIKQGLWMDCWGWQGDILMPLGNFSVEELLPDLTGKQTIVGEGLAAQVVLKPLKLLGLDDLFPIGGEPMPDYQMASIDISTQKLTVVHPEIPQVKLSVTTDWDECAKWLPLDAQNILGALFYCFPYPEYDMDKGATIPQHYLVWSFTPKPYCLGGQTEECKTYQYFLNEATANGGQVGFEVIGTSTGAQYSWMVTEPYLWTFVIPPVTCAGDMQYNVRMWYQPGNKEVSVMAAPDGEMSEIGDKPFEPLPPPNEVLYGPYSNTVSVPCNPLNLGITGKIQNVQYLDVTFESVEFFDIDDDDFSASGEDVELYGYFSVYAPSMGTFLNLDICEVMNCGEDGQIQVDRERFLNVANWEETSDDDCPGCLQTVKANYYNLQNWRMCQSIGKSRCRYDGQTTSFVSNNNVMRVFVTEGDALTFSVHLIDHDEGSDNDMVCPASEMTPSRSLEQWANVQGESYQLHSWDNGSGRCYVNIKINSVNP